MDKPLLEVAFWACIACIAYPYGVYPLILSAVARLWGRPVRAGGGDRPLPSVSVVLAAHNEEAAIGRRVREFAALIAASGLRGEVIVVSDGSTDGTAEAARTAGVGIVRVLDLPANAGKAAALNAGCALASHDVLVLADTRQTWAPEALGRLLENFVDPSVGGAGGDLVVEEAPGILAGVGAYWRFEKWLRRTESRLHSSVGLTGAICAVRREVFPTIPAGTVLDDVYWPMRVVMQGYRVVHDERARAFDRLPDRARDEFRRKVRTLCGNFQLVERLPALLLPWRNPIWWQFVSHKLARLVVPWALLGALVIGAALGGPLYRALFLIQIAAYLIAFAGMRGYGVRLRGVSATASFLVLNTAAWMAFWVWISGQASRSWGKVAYEAPVAGPLEDALNTEPTSASATPSGGDDQGTPGVLLHEMRALPRNGIELRRGADADLGARSDRHEGRDERPSLSPEVSATMSERYETTMSAAKSTPSRVDDEAPAFDALRARIDAGEARVGIIGLGYVGLPLARAFGAKGMAVLGFDVDPAKVEKLRRGESYIGHIGADAVREMARSGFEATDRFDRLDEPDAIIICVPTPLTDAREPDLSYVIASTEAIAACLRPGQLVVLESTTYPGTTREVVLPILEAGGLKAGRDFFLAFSPEREDPGNPDFSAPTIPKIVGGLEPASMALAQALYARVVVRVVPVSSPEVAEACKILENTYRAINIALVNELKVMYDRLGINVWEVIDAAKTKPFGYQAFYPGPGLGGHCIPIDPFYLTWLARRHGLTTRFIELAGEINTAMPSYVVGRVADALNDLGKPVKGSKVALLGMAYKKDVDDPRESPGFELMDLLQKKGAVVTYNDPHIPRLPPMRHYPHLRMDSQELTSEYLRGQDCVLVATDHSAYDWPWIAAHAPLIVDTRNALRGVEAPPGRVIRG